MAINRARLRGIMVSGGIAAEAPALEFTEALDEEIDASQAGLATNEALESSLRNQDDRLKLYIKEMVDRAVNRILAGLALTTSIISIATAITQGLFTQVKGVDDEREPHVCCGNQSVDP